LAELVIRVAAHADRAAFAELFKLLAPKVKAYMKRLGSDDALAEDLAQDVMVTLWHRAATFDPARASVMTWVYTIARNRRIDRLRRDMQQNAERLYAPVDDAPEPLADQQLEQAQRDARLKRAIAELPPEQSKLLVLAFYGDKSHTEIAAASGVPLGTVKSRVRLALERLRKALAGEV
jgi:RNA polymerase sigma-70 factor (ECF subfamily)